MTKKVGDHIPRLHDDQDLPEGTKRLLDLAAYEMQNDVVLDESASPRFDQADVGRSTANGSTFARVDGVTTSPKIPLHDNVWNRLNAAHPGLDSSEIEALMEYCYGGKSVYAASVNNFADFDPEKLEEIEAMSEVEVENFLGINPFEDVDDFDEEETEDES